MANKPVTTDVTAGSQYSASVLNANLAILEDAIEGCLGRGGTGESPNSMSGNLDMDTNKITNLGDPVADQDAATKKWTSDNYGTGAAVSAAAAAASATAAASSLSNMDAIYLGGHASAPTVDNNGDPLVEGASYYNTTSDGTFVWTGSAWATAYTDSTVTPSASETVEGKVEIATDAEAVAKTATDKAIVPSNLAALAATTTFAGLVERSTSAENITGASDTVYPTVAGVKEIVEIHATITKSFSSTAQTITAGGTLTVAHGMGVEPKLLQYVLECTTGNQGYSVGDRIGVPYTTLAASGNLTTPILDSTNITIKIAGSFYINNKTTTVSSPITNSSWKLYLHAFA